MNIFSISSMLDFHRNNSIKKNIFQGVFWLSIISGLIMMIYSGKHPYPRISPLYNLQELPRTTSNSNLYQAEIICSKFTLNLLGECGIDNYVIPPVCPFLSEVAEVYSWGPVVFSCNNPKYLEQYKKFSYDTPDLKTVWNVGLLLLATPFMVVVLMLSLIGLVKYLKTSGNLLQESHYSQDTLKSMY